MLLKATNRVTASDRPKRDEDMNKHPVFDWLREVAVAGARGQLTAREMALAIFVGLSGDGSSGRNAVVNDTQLTAELDVSRATVWRLFKGLVEAGWFVQTEKPARPKAGGGGGRRARYRVSSPSPTVILGDAASRVSLPSEDVRHVQPEDDRTCLTSGGERVASTSPTCRTDLRDSESVLRLTEPTSDGPTHPGHLPDSGRDRARELGDQADGELVEAVVT